MSEKTRNKHRDDLMPSAEQIAEELATVESMDDFFGRDGVVARLFASTLKTMLQAELTHQLGYERYEAKGRNSGNSRNGHYSKKVRTSSGDTTIKVPRDRRGDFEPQILQRYAQNSNELEEKILGMYAKGMSARDIREQLEDLYGVDVSAQTISAITDKSKVDPLVKTMTKAE